MRLHKFLWVLLVSLVGCKEKGPLIDIATTKPVSRDTTYLATVEKPQPKNVLIEEFTGVSCPPCPNGHEVVKSIKAQYPDRIVVIAYHILNFPQTAPVHNVSKYDFRTQDATDIGKFFGGTGSIPVAVIERIPENNAYFSSSGAWSNNVNKSIDNTPPMNMYLTSTYDSVTKIATVRLKIAYTQNLSKKHSLTMAVIESDIIDAQKNQLIVDTFYQHNYVLRDIVSSTYGDLILDSLPQKEMGRVIERSFSIPISSDWKPGNCSVVAFVHNVDAADKSVFQSVQSKIK